MKTQYIPSQGNRQPTNQGGQVPNQKTGISDQTNNIPPSGDDKTRNSSTNDSNNENNQIEPSSSSKTSSPINATNNTAVLTKPEKNKDTNIGEAPEVTGVPKESVIPFNIGVSDNGNLPPNVNDDNHQNDNSFLGKCDIILISVDIIP